MEKEKVEKAFQKYKDRLYFFAYGMLKDRDRSMDVVQEAFIKLYKEEKEIYNIKAWLFKVTKNLIIDHIRKNKRVITIEDLEIEDRYNNERRNRLIGILKKEIDNLPDLYKEIFILRDVDGYTYEEISRNTGLPIGTVKTRVYRARIILREKLKNELRKI